MGKKQHSKDRLFQTATEWREEGGGFREKKKERMDALPFYCCSLSLQQFKSPYATRDGYVFDLVEIIQWLIKKKCHPVTGKKMKKADLIKLNWDTFEQAGDLKYRCPVTYKTFNKHTHIVFIAKSGNVYSYNAIKEMNIKAKNWFDLLSGDPFKKEDIITIQDPHNLGQRDLTKFKAIKARANDIASNISKDLHTDNLMAKIRKAESVKKKKRKKGDLKAKFLKAKRQKTEDEKKQATKTTARIKSHLSTGTMAMGFTSTVMPIVTKVELQYLSSAEVRERICSKVRGSGQKGYVRLHTSKGNLNLQLHCDLVPTTCMNFLELCEREYYKDTIFHRKIVSFMIQGGDPTGTGRGGECAWGGQFKDEFHKMLRHDQRGILSMANAGPHTNGSQFYLSFGPTPHLDDVHSVFGMLVGGADVLNRLEKVACDDEDKPLEDIRITGVTVYTNPFKDVDLDEDGEKKKKKKEEKERLEADKGKWWSQPGAVSLLDEDSIEECLKARLKARKEGTLASIGKSSIFHLPNPTNELKKKKKKTTWNFSNSSVWTTTLKKPSEKEEKHSENLFFKPFSKD